MFHSQNLLKNTNMAWDVYIENMGFNLVYEFDANT